MIQFILMVNKQGQTRLAKYFNSFSVRERVTLEGELIRKCLSRTENQCSFLEHRQYKIIYRRYASLYFIVGVDNDEDVVSKQVHPHLIDLFFLSNCRTSSLSQNSFITQLKHSINTLKMSVSQISCLTLKKRILYQMK